MIKGDNKIIKFEDMRKKNGEVIESVFFVKMIFIVKCDNEFKDGDIFSKSKN